MIDEVTCQKCLFLNFNAFSVSNVIDTTVEICLVMVLILPCILFDVVILNTNAITKQGFITFFLVAKIYDKKGEA